MSDKTVRQAGRAQDESEVENGARQRKPRSTNRYEQKRQTIIDAATTIMNDHGVHGMTVGEVARAVGLNTSSVTYYFRLKEQLAAAAFEDTLSRIERLIEAASTEASPRLRVRKFVRLYLELYRTMHKDGGRPIADLSDMRALEDDVRAPLTNRYSLLFRRVRDFFGTSRSDEHRALNTARAQVLTETMYWARTWLFNYSYSDFGRIEDRLLDIFEHGLSLDGNSWSPTIFPVDGPGEISKGRTNFLRVATKVIGERGYRGASVERIAGELNVTKGSFYHHLSAKDDLVLDCFRHSYGRLAKVIRSDLPGTRWHRLSSIIATLLDMQLAGDWPLLRTTALQTLPPDARSAVIARSDRISLSLAGIISDGISEGSIRPADPLIAAQVIMPGLNAAYEQHNWAARFGNRQRAVELYASSLLDGFFDDRKV